MFECAVHGDANNRHDRLKFDLRNIIVRCDVSKSLRGFSYLRVSLTREVWKDSEGNSLCTSGKCFFVAKYMFFRIQ